MYFWTKFAGIAQDGPWPGTGGQRTVPAGARGWDMAGSTREPRSTQLWGKLAQPLPRAAQKQEQETAGQKGQVFSTQVAQRGKFEWAGSQGSESREQSSNRFLAGTGGGLKPRSQKSFLLLCHRSCKKYAGLQWTESTGTRVVLARVAKTSHLCCCRVEACANTQKSAPSRAKSPREARPGASPPPGPVSKSGELRSMH